MIPGAVGWELWSGSAATAYQPLLQTEAFYALEVEKLPAGILNFALPVRQLVALPFKAQTDDLSLLPDMASIHLEHHGVRPNLEGGELADYFVYSSEGKDTVLTPVVLTAPQEGELPRKSPNAFDVSARCLSMPRGKVAVWQELGRWVFGLGDGDRLLYFQCLPGDSLDERAGRDISLALTQLKLQGVLEAAPDELILWTSGGVTDPRPEEVKAFSSGAGLNLTSTAKPAPHWPTPPSRLLPADVRAERMAVKGRRNRNLMIAAMLVAYVGILAFFTMQYLRSGDEAQRLERKVAGLGPETQELLAHQEKWDELAPVTESDFYPYEVFHRVVKAAPTPSGNNKPVRLIKAVILNQYREVEGEEQVVRTITLRGNAADTKDVASFDIALKGNEDLSDFEWSTPPPQKGKGERWEFNYSGSVPILIN